MNEQTILKDVNRMYLHSLTAITSTAVPTSNISPHYCNYYFILYSFNGESGN